MHSPIVPWLHNNNLKLIFLGVFGGEEKEFNHQAIPSMCDEMIPFVFCKVISARISYAKLSLRHFHTPSKHMDCATFYAFA
jgi:hypothetical protein